MSRKRRGVPRFVQLHHRLLRSLAWHQLSVHARAAYVELASIYNGSNNGRLAVSVRFLAKRIPCGINRAHRALRELEDGGLIEALKIGKYTKREETRLASEYRLTEYRCDVTHDLPSRKYNPKVLWVPSEQKPKRRALSSTSRLRRKRCNADRLSRGDGTVSPEEMLVVAFPERRRVSRKKSRECVAYTDDATATVSPEGTLIHLTMGCTSLEGTLREKIGTKTTRAIFDTSLAPGHSTCPKPKIPSLPPGWHYCKFEKCVVTADGVQVPIVDHPLVGTEEGRAALCEWEAARDQRRKKYG